MEHTLEVPAVAPPSSTLATAINAARRRSRDPLVADAMRGLSALIASGVALPAALEVMAKHAREPRMRPVFASVRENVGRGMRLADSLDAHRDWFSDVCVRVIQAAERGSRLERGLDYAAEMIERDIEARGRVMNAAMYPAVIAVIGVVVVLLMASVVIPSFVRSAEEAGVALTGGAAVIAGGADFLTSPLGLLLVASAIGGPIAAAMAWRASAPFAYAEAVSVIPIFGRLVMLRESGRVADMLRLLVDAGVPMRESLILAGHATDSAYVAAAVNSMASNLGRGLRMADALAAYPRLPAQLVEMFAVGEEAGRLPAMLQHVSRTAQRELDSAVTRLPAALQPVALLILGGFVVGTALGFFIPYFETLMAISGAN